MWLKIEYVDPELKLTWGTIVDGSVVPHGKPFTIVKDSLVHAITAVRQELTNLAKWSSDSGTSARRRSILSKLASAGSSLRYELFRGQDDEREYIERLQNWIDAEYEGGDTNLAVYAPQGINVPWGLIFDGDPPPDAGPEDISAELSLFKGFWCFRRQLWITQVGYFPPPERIRGPHNSYGLLSLYNPEVLSDLRERGCKDDPVGERYAPPIGTACSASALQALIAGAKNGDIVFNFFGHHRNLELLLGSETISYSAFGQMMDSLATRILRLKKTSWGLIFLNACASAVGDEEITLRRVANSAALSGIIATEAIVPSRYAAKFGHRFLTDLIENGQRVGDIMKALYADQTLWPESLLYGYYVHPSYKISRPDRVLPSQSIATTEPKS